MKFNQLFFIALLVGLFCVAFSFEEDKKTTPLAKAPEISLLSPKGKTIKLSDLKGKLVLIDFWASWCGQNITRKSSQTARDLKFLAFP